MLHLNKMNRYILYIIVWLLCSSCLSHGYHHQFLSITQHEQLYPRQAVVGVSHRFNGKLLRDDGVFGQKLGANVAYFLRVGLPKLQSLQVSSSNLYDQFGLMYKKTMLSKLNSHYSIMVSYDQLTLNSNENSTLSGSLNYSYCLPTYDFAANIIYKDYFSSFQVALGVAYSFFKNTKFIYEVFSPVKEYKQEWVHIAGIKLMTFGHNFYFFVSNQNNVGYIASTSGADSQTFYSGFKIERIFDF